MVAKETEQEKGKYVNDATYEMSTMKTEVNCVYGVILNKSPPMEKQITRSGPTRDLPPISRFRHYVKMVILMARVVGHGNR